jgi:hypothetical protein
LWNGRTSKQCLWLGARQYCDCCRDTAAYPGSDSYATSNGHSVHGDNANAYSYSDCNSDSHGYGYSYAYCYDTTITNAYALNRGIAYPDTYTHSYAQGDPEASADSVSSAVSAYPSGW